MLWQDKHNVMIRQYSKITIMSQNHIQHHTQMCAFSYVQLIAVMYRGWRAPHSICHSQKDYMLHANFTTICVIEMELLEMGLSIWGQVELSCHAVSHCGNTHLFCSCDLDLHPI